MQQGHGTPKTVHPGVAGISSGQLQWLSTVAWQNPGAHAPDSIEQLRQLREPATQLQTHTVSIALRTVGGQSCQGACRRCRQHRRDQVERSSRRHDAREYPLQLLAVQVVQDGVEQVAQEGVHQEPRNRAFKLIMLMTTHASWLGS